MTETSRQQARFSVAKSLNDRWIPGSDDEKLELLAAVAEATEGEPLANARFGSFQRTLGLNLSHIRFHGMDEVPCLILASSGLDAREEVLEFCRTVPITRIAIILTFTESGFAEAREHAPKRQCIVMSFEQIDQLLTARDGREWMRRLMLATFHRLALVPFNLLRPVDAHMFFGRRSDVARLLEQPDVSFALCGPEGLGKTSLLRQYERELIRSRDRRAQNRYYINFLSCPATTEPAIARHLAMVIDPCKASSELTPERDGIERFLKRQRRKHNGQALDLMLDDVDEVCKSDVFQALGLCAKDGICRLIVSGRSGLLELMLDKSSDLKGRLELIRLEPLDQDSAAALLLQPLRDLGWAIEQPDDFCGEIFKLTGQLPHLLQHYGKKICDFAIRRNLETVTVKLIDDVKWDFDTVNLFTAALRGIRDKELKRLALLLLRRQPRHITPMTLEGLAAENKIQIDRETAEDHCKRLVLESVLAWRKGDFALSSEVLAEYAERQGMFRSLSHRNLALSKVSG